MVSDDWLFFKHRDLDGTTMIWPTSSGGESQDTPDEVPSSFYNYCGSVCPTQLRSKRKPDSPSLEGARKILVIANPNFSNATSGAAAVVPATIGLSTSGSGSDISAASGHGAGSASTSGSVCDVDSDVGERSAQPSPPTERINVHRTGLMSLPLEVLLIICQHMDVKDLSSLRRASRHLNAIVEVDVLWQRLCQVRHSKGTFVLAKTVTASISLCISWYCTIIHWNREVLHVSP